MNDELTPTYIQDEFKLLGADGCFVLSIIKVLRLPMLNAPLYMRHGIEKGYLRANDLYMLDDSGFSSMINGKKIIVTKEPLDYPYKFEMVIQHGMRTGDDGHKSVHFNLPYWDGMSGGKFEPIDLRILREVKE